MQKKRILVLANSVKKGVHCVAGREVVGNGLDASYGAWIRPVSRMGEGELTSAHCALQNSMQPRIWDVVDVSLDAHEGSCAQPENWYIDPETRWVKIGERSTLGLPPIHADTPPDLWLDRAGPSDRIAPATLSALNRNQSLYLVAVADFRLAIEWNAWKGRHARRACFTYCGQSYRLSMTDPDMERYCRPFPPSGEDRTVELSTGGEKLLCVSLSAPFGGNHYKIVATVLEPAT